MKVKICIVVSTYNKQITNEMCKMAKTKLSDLGIKKIDTVNVPGAFEIPVAIAKLIKKYDGFIAIGCIIKGETANFELISKAITDGIMQLSIPVVLDSNSSTTKWNDASLEFIERKMVLL